MNLDSPAALARMSPRVAAALATWAGTVTVTSATGVLARLAPTILAPLIVAGIVVPTVVYNRSPLLRAAARELGVHRISLLHTWRIAAGVMFLRVWRRRQRSRRNSSATPVGATSLQAAWQRRSCFSRENARLTLSSTPLGSPILLSRSGRVFTQRFAVIRA